MNPIAIWHKWSEMSNKSIINPVDWMYKYRIPKLEEFIDGFKYEYLTLMITKPNDIIEVNYQQFIFGSEATGHSLEKIKQMLETGYIRVKVDESNKKEEEMKLFYFETKLRKLKRKKDTDLKKESPAIDNPIIGIGDFEKDQKIWYIISKGISPKDAFDNIHNQLLIRDNGFGETQKLLQLSSSGHNAYTIISGGEELTKENLKDFRGKFEEIYVLQNSMYLFSEIWPKNEVARTEKVQVKNQQGKKLAIIGKKDKMYPVYQNKPKQKIGRVCVKLPNPTKKIDIIKKEQYQWKPVTKPETKQHSKSENRLVWIASEKSGDVRRLPWVKAEELVTTQGYKYIPKGEAKKIAYTTKSGETRRKVKIGKSFTPALSDNGIYVPKSKFHTSKSSTPKVVKKKKTTSLRNPKDLHEYVVTLEKHIADKTGTAEYVYTIIAPNLDKAINRAKLRLLEADSSIEHTRNHGNLILPLFKARGEEIVKDEVSIPEKKDNSTKSFLEPITVKLNTPLTKSEYDEKSAKLVKKDVFEITKWVRVFTKKQIVEKVKKKWKHPIKDSRKK